MSFLEADRSLCRTYLTEIVQDTEGQISWEKKDLWWFRIAGITNFYKSVGQNQYVQVIQDILSGCMMPACCVGFWVIGTQNEGIQIYAGITDDEELYGAYQKSFEASFPGIDISHRIVPSKVRTPFGGIVVGIPCESLASEQPSQHFTISECLLPIDRLCRGMLGTEFSFLVLAERQPDSLVQKAIQKVDKAITENSKFLNSTRTGEGGWQIVSNNIEAQNYQKNLEKLIKILNEGAGHGLWNVTAFYECNKEIDLYRMKSMLLSCFTGQTDSRFERIMCIDIEGGIPFENGEVGLPMKLDAYRNQHILNNIGENAPEYYKYTYQTMMSTQNLANYFCLPQREIVGFYVDDFVEFDTVVRESIGQRNIRIGNIAVPGRKRSKNVTNIYSMDIDDLSRHALIVGITGGGKTNTMKVLLSEIWRKNGVPFLVIESAKREYIELAQLSPVSGIKEFDSLDVFTLGNETIHGVKYRLNPFEVVSGVALQTHIDYLLSTFNAAFEMYPPMPYILEQAVYEVYADKGWDLFSNRNIKGLKEYPTLSQLYYKIDVVTDRLGYDAEVQSNVKAALKARINSLRIGGKGAMLDTPRSIPIEQLLSNPTVFELEDIGDDDTKAFVIGILLVQLYEYRKASGSSKELKGVLIVEEAHRLLKNVSGTEGNNSRAKAVDFFCNMLAEIRSFGQGIIIADQIPTKLASDTIKNTNLKIVHRTVMEDDRECIGAAMHMTEEQKNYLSSLGRGCAAVFKEGDNRPKLVEVPLVRMEKELSREILIVKIQQNVLRRFGEFFAAQEERHIGCKYCENRKCPENEFRKALEVFSVDKYREEIMKKENFTLAMMAAIKLFESDWQGEKLTKQQRMCLMGELLHRLNLTEEKQAEVLVNYMCILYPV